MIIHPQSPPIKPAVEVIISILWIISLSKGLKKNNRLRTIGEMITKMTRIFDETTIVNLFDFKSAVDKYKDGKEEDLRKMLMPAETAIKQVLPIIEIEKKAIKGLHVGRPLFLEDVTNETKGIETDDRFAVFSGDQFIGIYRRTTEEIIFGRPEFVYS